MLALVNAGHAAPHLARAGTVTVLELSPDLPFGLFLDATGHALSDDTTVLILDWDGHHGDGRHTEAGADVQVISS